MNNRPMNYNPPAPALDAYATDKARWSAVVGCDRRADGAFVYAVETTGVYCRPSCPSRTPNRENVRFFADPEAAEAAGFRPCKRCTPADASLQERYAEVIVRACRLIEDADEPPSLDDLAAAVGLSASHFHRVFTSMLGITPKAYADAERARRVRTELQHGSSVTRAIFEAGYSSSSRFYEGVRHRLGMTPAEYQDGASDLHIRYACAESSLGWVVVAATARGVCSVEFGASPEALVDTLRDRFPDAELIEASDALAQWTEAVVAHVETPHAAPDLPLDIRGTAFQERVWKTLREIPMGTTKSYGEVAEMIGTPTAARAVAGACAANKIAVLVPCHRVVRGDGDLSGYRWGTNRKRTLLEREAAEAV